MKRFILAIQIFLIIVISSKVAATPVSYDEAVSGDINEGQQAPVFFFDEGINTVSGRMSFGAFSQSDYDNFVFNIPDGKIVNSILVSISNFEASGLDVFGWLPRIISGSGRIASQNVTLFSNLSTYPLDISPIHLFEFPPAVVPGAYGNFHWNNSLGSFYTDTTPNALNWSAHWDYGISMELISPMPVPTTISLFIVGLLGLRSLSVMRLRGENSFRPTPSGSGKTGSDPASLQIVVRFALTI